MSYTNARNRYEKDGTGVVPQPRLLLMLFDRLVLDVRTSIDAIATGQIELSHKKLTNAQAILWELHAALDTKAWPEGEGLAQLYLWLNEQLVEANCNKDGRKLKACMGILDDLNATWKQAYASLSPNAVATPANFSFVAPPVPAG